MNKADFNGLTRIVQRDFPNFEIRYKDESFLMKILGILCWVFNRRFMTNFTTTLYPYVYFPSREYVEESPDRAFRVLAHEYVHLWDRRTQGIWFSFSYLCPQIYALPLLGAAILAAVTQSYWIMGGYLFGAAVCLLPLPAYWRMKWELRGYAMGLAIQYWNCGRFISQSLNFVERQFTGWTYYKMWPFSKDIRKRINHVKSLIAGDSIGHPYRQVYELLKR